MKKIIFSAFTIVMFLGSFTLPTFAATTTTTNPESGMTREQKIAAMKAEAGTAKKSTVKPIAKKNKAVIAKALAKIKKVEKKAKTSTKK